MACHYGKFNDHAFELARYTASCCSARGGFFICLRAFADTLVVRSASRIRTQRLAHAVTVSQNHGEQMQAAPRSIILPEATILRHVGNAAASRTRGPSMIHHLECWACWARLPGELSKSRSRRSSHEPLYRHLRHAAHLRLLEASGGEGRVSMRVKGSVNQ